MRVTREGNYARASIDNLAAAMRDSASFQVQKLVSSSSRVFPGARRGTFNVAADRFTLVRSKFRRAGAKQSPVQNAGAPETSERDGRPTLQRRLRKR